MINNPYRGKFIVIEGLDGSGQTSQVSLLKDFLIEKDCRAMSTKEPTRESEAGKRIKEILEKEIKIDSLELQKLFAQDRKWHLENKIIPALKEGIAVISDRYFFSTFAYGAADGSDLSELIKINDGFIYPDLILFLKVSPEVCIDRIEKRGDPRTLFEKREQLAKVWENYKELAVRFRNINIIDGEEPIEGVFDQIKKVVLFNILKKKED